MVSTAVSRALCCWHIKPGPKWLLSHSSLLKMHRLRGRRALVILSILVTLLITSCHSANSDDGEVDKKESQQDDYYDSSLTSGIYSIISFSSVQLKKYRVDQIKRCHEFQPVTSEVLLGSSLFLAQNKAI